MTMAVTAEFEGSCDGCDGCADCNDCDGCNGCNDCVVLKVELVGSYGCRIGGGSGKLQLLQQWQKIVK